MSGYYNPDLAKGGTHVTTRAETYAMADAAGQIGLEFDEIKILLDRLLKDMDALPKPTDVADTYGASASVAATFSTALQATVNDAAEATVRMKLQIEGLSDAILATITELTGVDSEAKAVLSGTQAQLEADGTVATPKTYSGTGSITIPVAPATTSSQGTRGPGSTVG